MSVNKVNSDGSLSRIAGGTLYADLPVGSWVKNDSNTIPSGFLKAGDTISQTLYPELYAMYGSTVPYKADTSELSDYETITLPTTPETAMTMPYDGFYILANYGVVDVHHIYLNGVEISMGTTGSAGTGASTSSTIPFKKGDTMYRINTYSSTLREHVAYYKKSLIVKAKQVAVPFDVAEYIRNQNVLSGIEVVTLPMTAPYDGELIAVGSNGGYVTFSINGSQYTVGSSTGMTYTSGLSIKKGDVLTLESLIGTAGFTTRYYKLRDYTGR